MTTTTFVPSGDVELLVDTTGAVAGATEIIPSTIRIAAAGAPLVMPFTNVRDIWEFDDMDSAEIVIADAPRASEIVVALAVAAGGRAQHRTSKPTPKT